MKEGGDERDGVTRIQEALGYLYRPRRAGVMREHVARDAGLLIDPPQSRALTALAAESCSTVGDLAKACDVGHSTMSRTVGRLTQLGLIERDGDSGDGRIVMLRLSESGWETYRRLQDATVQLLAELFEGWSAADTSNFAEKLERYAEGIRRFADEHQDAGDRAAGKAAAASRTPAPKTSFLKPAARRAPKPLVVRS